MPSEIPLAVQDLVKHYGDVEAVRSVSFEVPRGRVFCLLGPNGAGKTTTLEMAQGLRKPTSGRVLMFGQDPRKAGPEMKRRVGILPQRFMSYDQLTVRENVQYMADVYDVRPDVDALLESLGLAEHADRRYKDLSGGTKRRVGIVTALVNDPELIFLDEPTAGVDPASRRQLWDVLHRLRKEGRAIVLTTHYMDEAEHLADEVAIIQDGRIVARGTPERVRLDHGGSTVLKIHGLSGRLPPVVASRPGIVEEREGDYTIPLEDRAEGALIVSELVKGGLVFREIAIREPTLDDAFVQLANGRRSE